MRRISWLDQIVYRFQHQWETNPQYRAAAMGVIGLVVIITMCGAIGLVSATANSALAAIGLGSGSSAPTGTPNTGTRGVNGYLQFHTPVVTYPAQTPPVVATIPDSQTPLPGPTATDTPQPTDTPGPGGNYACSGSNHKGDLSYNVVPCPATAGQGVTISLSAPNYPNTYGNVVINFDPAGNHTDCTWLFQNNGIKLNGQGYWSTSATIGADCGGSGMPISISVSINSGPQALFQAPPVQ